MWGDTEYNPGLQLHKQTLLLFDSGVCVALVFNFKKIVLYFNACEICKYQPVLISATVFSQPTKAWSLTVFLWLAKDVVNLIN